MRPNVRTTCLAIALASAAITVWTMPKALSLPPAAPPGYQLVWSDEFTKDGPLDPANWSFERGFVRNEELQWYQPENAHCSNGQLVIEARREQVQNPRYVQGSNRWQTSRKFADYTSACATTSRHHAWLYGRFEMRAKVDTASGSWPAFWMLGTSRPWPACGEVDIMEYYRNMVLANIAWGKSGRGPAWNSVRKPLAAFKDDHWSDGFHVWRMDWDEKTIALYLDDQLMNSQDLAKTLNNNTAGDNPFHRPMYLLLNLAIGGQQGGDAAQSHFPMHYEIDYVRVYQTPAEIAMQKK